MTQDQSLDQMTPSPDDRERAILVGLDRPGLHGGLLERLEELSLLAETANCDTVASVTQARAKPDPKTYIGKGKVEELVAAVEEYEADVIIVDSELPPSQSRNLAEAVQRKVVDRTQLILDIFARRASTRLARDQVELALLQYSLPRLKRLWTHLSRIEGGVGMRGPGERQIETDRRLARERIHRLQQRLIESEKQKSVASAGRQRHFTASLVGYTNVGKSTLMNALTDAGVFVEDRLFATLDATTRRLVLDGEEILLSDTVGFIRDLPHALVASFHATLSEVREADLLLHVVDIASPELEEQIESVRTVLEEIGAQDQATLTVFNKVDALEDGLSAEGIANRFGGGVLISAITGQGLDELRQTMLDRSRALHRPVELLIPYSDGKSASLVEQHGQVLEREYLDTGTRMRVLLAPADLSRLENYVL
ncbi:MAG: GTPase HflX [Armatimonadetes bacterium]|nr:GTPase HflX [Armatimonadota bacterium]